VQQLTEIALYPLREIDDELTRETGLTCNELESLISAGVVRGHHCVISGAFVFAGTRVPVYNLWDYLAGGDSLDEFLDGFPTVPLSC